MNKIMALDLGDAWTGVALSDALHIIATPYTTVKTENLIEFIEDIIKQEPIKTIVLGLPKTLKGSESEQTKKTYEYEKLLSEKFDNLKIVLWDERLTSKRAQQQSSKKSDKKRLKEEKIKSHARAASFILDSYLTYLSSNT